jgi:hypothetical protein
MTISGNDMAQGIQNMYYKAYNTKLLSLYKVQYIYVNV